MVPTSAVFSRIQWSAVEPLEWLCDCSGDTLQNASEIGCSQNNV